MFGPNTQGSVEQKKVSKNDSSVVECLLKRNLIYMTFLPKSKVDFKQNWGFFLGGLLLSPSAFSCR